MRIRLTGTNVIITDPIRVYAEYRLFSSVARYGDLVRRVDVALRQDAGDRDRRFLCSVMIDLGPSGRVKTQARGDHPNAVIDRAANRAAWLVSRHSPLPVSS